jgi:hypothetical protein
MGTGKRQGLVNMKEALRKPGPGEYDRLNDSLFKKSAPKFGFGTSKREDNPLEKSRAKINIGPGSYENKSFVGNEGNRNSLSPKLSNKQLEREI